MSPTSAGQMLNQSVVRRVGNKTEVSFLSGYEISTESNSYQDVPYHE